MNQVTRNIIRTVVPTAVGAVATWITKQAAHLTPAAQVVVFPIATSCYYSVIRLAEVKYPKLGWLLGALPQPKTKTFPAGTTGVATKP